MTTEAQFEMTLIDYLQNMKGVKQWKYEKDIKTTDQLWDNFKSILESLNQDKLDQPLSTTEFAQVKKHIQELRTPYQSGSFLYGLNGISEIDLTLDNGDRAVLTVFDQRQIGAGNTVYQVVNQIERIAKIPGNNNRRFDVTLLINGLPIIHIEEKKQGRDAKEALNQMHQYIDELQFEDIFSTLQILVAATPYEVLYMANTTSELFNTDFAFHWQDEKGEVIRDWQTFADQFLSIPMAHQMSTNYMILDGTKNKQMLKVMRPYQVYATKKIIDKIKTHDFESKENRLGYIWHTTGSGKTITSFKTSWLASRLPNIDKVVFVVDRIALTDQTTENYRAYDPENLTSNGEEGIVKDTKHTSDLVKQLKSKGSNIIVTSVQKLGRYVKSKNFKPIDKKIVFIVDEAHRSTGGDTFAEIQAAFKKAAWVGYTGTPVFDDQKNKIKTQEIFGELLHSYTIKNAIADRNVLGFDVDFVDVAQIMTTCFILFKLNIQNFPKNKSTIKFQN